MLPDHGLILPVSKPGLMTKLPPPPPPPVSLIPTTDFGFNAILILPVPPDTVTDDDSLMLVASLDALASYTLAVYCPSDKPWRATFNVSLLPLVFTTQSTFSPLELIAAAETT